MLSTEKKIRPPKKTSKGDLPKDAESWVQYVNELHGIGLSIRTKHELSWALNHAYVKGYQDIIFNYKSGRIEIPKTMSRPLTVNRIGAFVDARVAKLTKNRPHPRTIPNSNDNEDANAAKYSDSVLMHLWRKTDLEGEYTDLITKGLIYGTSFLKCIWNPHAGDYIRKTVGDEDEGVLHIAEEGEIKTEKIFMGEVDSESLSPFAIIPGNENIKNVKDQPWLIERAFHHVHDLEKFYPHLKGKLVGKSTNEEQRTDYEAITQRLASPISSAVGSGLTNIHDSLNDQVLCKKLWIRPCPEYENGLVVIVIGDLLAHISEFPHDYGENVYPYFKFVERDDGLSFFQQATVERLLSIQKNYNRLKQKKLKNAMLCANVKWLVPKGSQIHEDALNDAEGEIISYNPAVPAPQQAIIAPMPNYVTQLEQSLIDDFRDVSGQREASMTPSPNVTAGIALSVQAELSDEILGPIIKRLGRIMGSVAHCQLLLINEEYIEPRKIAILGENNSFGVQYISAADLKHHVDIHVEIESLFPEFRGAKQQRLIDLWDRKIISDPETFLKAYRFGNLDEILEGLERDDDPVHLDIAQIKKGREPEIQPYQNHAAYFKVLSKWIQTPEFMRLIPERKQLAINVLQAHMKYLLQSMPNQGQPAPNQNQAAVGTPFGAAVPEGGKTGM